MRWTVTLAGLRRPGPLDFARPGGVPELRDRCLEEPSSAAQPAVAAAPVTREAARWAYRVFLGREPEGEASLAACLGLANLAELRDGFLRAPEFVSRPVAWLPKAAPPGHAALRRRADGFKWFHSLRLSPAIVTRGQKPEDILLAETAALFDPLPLAGWSALDVGAWNGHFSFAAKRRGASRVVASDGYAWRHPEWRGRAAMEFAAAALGLEIEAAEAEPDQVWPALGEFDLVLFLGVFYHLLNPVPALLNLRRATRRLLLLETYEDARAGAEPAMVFYPGKELDGDPTNWWGPNPRLVAALLRHAAGFGLVLRRAHPNAPNRGMYAAFVRADDPAAAGFRAAGWEALAG